MEEEKHLTANELALFLGCKVEYFDYFTNAYETGILSGISDENYFFIKDNNNGHEIQKCRPFLRPISDITDMELEELFMIKHTFHGETILKVEFSHREERFGNYAIRFHFSYKMNKDGREGDSYGTISFKSLTPKQFQYMISKHFDIFGWVNDNLAIHAELQNVLSPGDVNLFPPIT